MHDAAFITLFILTFTTTKWQNKKH